MKYLFLISFVFMLSGCVQRGDVKVITIKKHITKIQNEIQNENKEIKEFLKL